jgi:very-short-patch-repair endonuclease
MPLVVGGRRLRLDFGWPEVGRAAEIDGARFHNEDSRSYDLRRQNGVVLGGWAITRFTWQDVALYPEYVLGVLDDWFS